METKRGHHALVGEGGSHLPTNDPLSSPKLVYRGGNSGIYVVARNFILLLLSLALPGSCLTRFTNRFPPTFALFSSHLPSQVAPGRAEPPQLAAGKCNDLVHAMGEYRRGKIGSEAQSTE